MKYLNILCAGCMLFLLTACEKDLPVFEDEECLLNFYYGSGLMTSEVTEAMRNSSHSFKLNSEEGQNVDTVWLEISTMGKISAENRPVALEQIMVEEANNAVAGKHYVAFDDVALEELYCIPAGKEKTRIPVVVMRDPSLETGGDVILKITFRDNGYFKVGYSEFSTCTLTISDKLSRPTAWDNADLDYYFGRYGATKHELMIKWSGEAWDDTYIASLFYDKYGNGYLYAKDGVYINYLTKWFAERLAEENEERLANGEGVWSEADGSAVDFTPVR